jgi:hypothetical protein
VTTLIIEDLDSLEEELWRKREKERWEKEPSEAESV